MINYELGGKVAVVTGGASRIGLACAHALARSGASVCLWDLKGEALEKAVAEVEPSTAGPLVRQPSTYPIPVRSTVRWKT